MTFSQLDYGTAALIGAVAFISSVFSLAVTLRAFTAKAGRAFCFFCAAVSAFGIIVMYYAESWCVIPRYPQYQSLVDIDLFGGIPASAAALLSVLPAAAAAVLAAVMHRNLRSRLTPASLREGLDMLSDGIAFGTDSGIPLLVNSKMQYICGAAFGKSVIDTGIFESITADELRPGCSVERDSAGTFLHLPDESVWNIRITPLKNGKRTVKEYAAYDVTEQYLKSEELKKRNERLAAVNAKIRLYSRNMDAIVREKEILAAKVRIHDDAGRSLLVLRAYLSGHGARKDVTELWERTVSVLKRESEIADNDDRLAALSEAANAVGVRLELRGEMPGDKTAGRIVAAAIHECLTNTVKHAGGDSLNVRLTEDGNDIRITITNNGRPPEKPIAETGGLNDLRKTVGMYGGTMDIHTEGGFTFTITINKEPKIYENTGNNS